ncbi:MAG: sulfatase-like hydrolase/transferase, partial [Chloroflexota bacterium]|nr:sulfatase-like hydrolase/transferase [Chloroflexota bacterium]
MKRPNILILSTDQHRWDALGVNGNREIHTPHLDTLAAQGLTFTRHFVQHPVCMPSRVSFLTGRYPSALGITHMGVPVPLDTLTLPRMLKPYGYATGQIGKLHFLPHANRDHREPHPDYGFDHLEIADEPGPYEDAYRAWVRRQAPDQLDHISPGLPPLAETWYRVMGVKDTVRHPAQRFPKEALPFRGRSDLTHTAFVSEQTQEFIRAHRARPWLCVAGFYSPHSPWVAPQEFLDLYNPATLSTPAFPEDVETLRATAGEDGDFADSRLRAARHGYYAMISEVDHHVGRLLATLDELNLYEDTIVVFTADHGDWLGEHLRHGKGYPAPDAVSRVPLLLRWPAGIVAPGRAVSGLAEAVDVLPTLLEGAGIQVPPLVQGRSLLPVLLGAPETGRASALTDAHGWKSLRTEHHRYVCRIGDADAPNGAGEHLWDLQRDPGEYADVAAEPAYAAVVAEHRRLLLTRLLQNEQPLPR